VGEGYTLSHREGNKMCDFLRIISEENEALIEAGLVKEKGCCRVCGGETRGLRVFCEEHLFTVKTGFDPHEIGEIS